MRLLRRWIPLLCLTLPSLGRAQSTIAVAAGTSTKIQVAPGMKFHPIEPESSTNTKMLGGSAVPVASGVVGMVKEARAGTETVESAAERSPAPTTAPTRANLLQTDG
mgnify:CR=1 FL=1